MPFSRLTVEKIPQRLLVSVWGQEKVGKTHFALTFPGPIYFFDFDLGAETVMPKFADKEVYYARYNTSLLSDNIDTYQALWNGFKSDLSDALASDGGTIVFDSATQIWSLVQKVYLDKIMKRRESRSQQVYPFDYADANIAYEGLISAVKENKDMNLVLTHRAREIYSNKGQRTGTYEAQQNSRTPYFVQWVVQLYKDQQEHIAKVESCRFGSEFEGITLKNLDYNGLTDLLGW
jgi:hypothetical protein